MRPGLLGRNKDEFSSSYCGRRWINDGGHNKLYVGGGSRLLELNLLLTKVGE